ncbi:Serine/threonine-protein phosphatase 2A activator 2 [Phlyctochytrium planicorne]|nr:Serine/threonine-protein phosphatase 2A activator 2 [Phlyctochytrium planicorne]
MISDGIFRAPTKAILSKDDLERWEGSDTYKDYLGFIERLNVSVKNLPLSANVVESEVTVGLMSCLDTVESWVKEIPPQKEGKSRFGNPAFQEWYDRLEANCLELTMNVVSSKDAAQELSVYLLNSFGNRKRIDYGTGHEAHFIAFLMCLEKVGLVTETDYPALVLKVFWRYIGVMRKLQFTYWLEPAGSHGVWGLDDYHFLPFMFGSSQLHDHKYLKPKCIHDKEVVDEFSKDYMYLACIKFINSVKSASLRWHSPMLDDISGVKLWSKVNSGMIKMFKAEVLGKLPIMQHFLFGSLIQFEASGPLPSEHDELAHVHAFGQIRPECCFIRVPSSIAAAAAAKEEGKDGASAWSNYGVGGNIVGALKFKALLVACITTMFNQFLKQLGRSLSNPSQQHGHANQHGAESHQDRHDGALWQRFRTKNVDSVQSEMKKQYVAIQSKVFVRWLNMHLSKQSVASGKTSLIVRDIGEDLKDGTVLLQVMHLLTGEALGKESGGLRIHHINNVNKVIQLLESKLGNPLDIGAEEIVDGNVKLTLALVWYMISMHTSTAMQRRASASSSSESSSRELTQQTQEITPPVTPSRRKSLPVLDVPALSHPHPPPHTTPHPPHSHTKPPASAQPKSKRQLDASTKSVLLEWCQKMLLPYKEVGILPGISDFSRNWQNGVAFLALVHTFDPTLVPDLTDLFLELDKKRLGLQSVVSSDPESHSARYVFATSKSEWMQTLSRAFSLAELKLGINRLLDPEDLIDIDPDEKSVILYVAEFRRIMEGRSQITQEKLTNLFNRRPSLFEDSSLGKVQSTLSAFMADANKLTAWLNHQQQSLHRLTRAFYSDQRAPPHLSNLSSWCQRIFDVIVDPNSQSKQISMAIEKELLEIEGVLQALSLEPASVDSLESPNGLENSQELTITNMGPVFVRMKLEGLFSNIKELSASLKKEEELIVSYQLKEVKESYEGLLSQIDIFSKEIFPNSAEQLRAFGVYSLELETVLDDIRKEISIGSDGTSGLCHELEAARVSVLMLEKELEEATKTALMPEDAISGLRTSLLLEMVAKAAGTALASIFVNVLAKSPSPSSDHSSSGKHPLEVLADRVEREDVAVIQGLGDRVEELIVFLQNEILGNDGQPRTPLSPTGLQFKSKETRLVPFSFIPPFLYPIAELSLKDAQTILKVMEEEIMPKLRATVTKIKRSRLSVFDHRDQVKEDLRKSIEKARPRAEIYAFAITDIHGRATQSRNAILVLTAKHIGQNALSMPPEMLEAVEDEILQLATDLQALFELVKFSLDKKWSALVKECDVTIGTHVPHAPILQLLEASRDQLASLKKETVEAAKEEMSKKLSLLLGDWVVKANAFEDMIHEASNKFTSRVVELSSLYGETMERWLSSWQNPESDALSAVVESERLALNNLEEASTTDTILTSRLEELDMGILSSLLDEAGQLLAKGMKPDEEEMLSLRVSRIQATAQKYQRSLDTKEGELSLKRRELLATKESMRISYKSGLEWLEASNDIKALLKELSSDVESLQIRVKELLSSKEPFTDALVDCHMRFESIEARIEGVQVSHAPTSAWDSLPATVAGERNLERQACFSHIVEGLEALPKTLQESLSAIESDLEVADAFDLALQELSESAAVLKPLLESRSVFEMLPHALDPSCNEEAIAVVERELATLDSSVSGWQKVMRRAKAEQAVAALIKLKPPEELVDFIRERSAFILSQVSTVAETSRGRWDQLATVRMIMKEVAIPGRKLDATLKEINSMLLTAIAENASDEASDAGGCQQKLDFTSELKFFAVKLESVNSLLNAVVASGNSTKDELVLAFCRKLLDSFETSLAQLAESSSECLAKMFQIWNASLGKSEAECDRILGLIGTVHVDADSVALISAKFEALEKELFEFTIEIEKLFELTQIACETLQIWSAIHETLQIPISHDKVAFLLEGVLAVPDSLPHAELIEFLLASTTNRESQLRQRVVVVSQAIQNGIDFAQLAKTVLIDLDKISSDLSKGMEDLSLPNLSAASAIEALSNMFREHERCLYQILTELNGSISFSIEEIASNASVLVEETIGSKFIDHIERAWKVIFELHSARSQELEGLQQQMVLTIGLLRQIVDLQDLMSAREGGLQKMTKSLGDEGSLIKSLLAETSHQELSDRATAQLRYNAERKVMLAKEESNFGKIRESITSMEIIYEKISAMPSCGMDTLCRRLLEETHVSANEIESRETQISKSLDDRVRLLNWIRNCLELSGKAIPERQLRLDNGEGWSAIFTEIEHDDAFEKQSLNLDAFGSSVDTLVRRWEDDLLGIEENVDRVREEALIVFDASEGDLALPFLQTIQGKLKKLQDTFEDYKAGLFDLGGSVEGLSLKLDSLEGMIIGTMSLIKHRHGLGSSVENNLRPGTPSLSGYIVITGNEALDSQNIQLWSEEHVAIEVSISATILPSMEDVEATSAKIEEQAVSLLKGSGKVLLQQANRKRMDQARSQLKELQRSIIEEKWGIDIAKKYYGWHSDICSLEGQLDDIDKSLALSPPTQSYLDDVSSKIEDVQRAFEAIQMVCNQDYSRRRSSTSSSLQSPLTPTFSNAPPSPPPPGRDRDMLGLVLPVDMPRPMTSSTSSSRFSERRPSTLSVNVSKITARTSNSVMDASELANISSLRTRLESFSEKLEKLTSEFSKRVKNIYGDAEPADDLSFSKSSADDTGSSQASKTLSSISQWCEEFLSRDMNISLIATGYITFLAKFSDLPTNEDMDSIHSDLLSRIHNASRFQNDSHTAYDRYVLLLNDIKGSDSAIPEGLNEIVHPILEKLQAIEKTLVNRGKEIDLVKGLTAFAREWKELQDWVDSAKSILLQFSSLDLPISSLVSVSFEISEEKDIESKVHSISEKVIGFRESLRALESESESLIDSARKVLTQDEADQLAAVISTILKNLRAEFEFLDGELIAIEGSISQKSKERDFEVSFTEVENLLEAVYGRLVARNKGSEGLEDEDGDASGGDTEIGSILGELKGEMEGIIAPRIVEIVEMGSTLAQTIAEREHHLAKCSVLEKEYARIFERLERESLVIDSLNKGREIEAIGNDILKMQAEFATILQEHTSKIFKPSQPSELTINEMSEAISGLEDRFEWYESQISKRMEDLAILSKSVPGDKRHQDLYRKWQSLSMLKSSSLQEMRRRQNAKKMQMAASKTSSIPRITTSSTGMARSSSASPTLPVGPRLSPTSPTDSGLRTPLFRTPSPRGEFGRNSVSPLGPRSLSNGNGRLSPNPSPSRNQIKIMLPTPNNYVPNPNDPLDVEVARVVNACPLRIKVVPSRETKSSYWFGDLMPRLCYCRIVRAGTVMVRVGGGWQELSSFLKEHSTLETSLPKVRSFASAAEDGEDFVLISKDGSDGNANASEASAENFIILPPDQVQNPYSLSFNRALRKS